MNNQMMLRVATQSCNIKHIIGITWINLNYNSSAALELSVINNWVGAETQICYVFEIMKTICHLDC